jgi:hypothetical protein
MEIYIHFPIRLHGVELKHRHRSTQQVSQNADLVVTAIAFHSDGTTDRTLSLIHTLTNRSAFAAR